MKKVTMGTGPIVTFVNIIMLQLRCFTCVRCRLCVVHLCA